MKLKYCGLRHANTCKHAENLGVDYTGIVHYPASPRHCSESTLEKIKAKMNSNSYEEEDFNETSTSKKPKKVLVVVNENVDHIAFLVKQFSFDIVQLHGDENELFVEKLKNTFHDEELNTTIWKVLRIRSTDEVSIKTFSTFSSIKYFIVEPYHKDFGGAGESMPLEILKHVLSTANKMNKLVIAAGGITLHSLKELSVIALEFPNLYGLDVSSGIEKIRGIKDFELMTQFHQQYSKVFR